MTDEPRGHIHTSTLADGTRAFHLRFHDRGRRERRCTSAVAASADAAAAGTNEPPRSN